MKYISIFVFLLCGITEQAFGQKNFTEQLTRSKVGEGKVTIHQSPQMDALVNGTASAAPATTQAPGGTQTATKPAQKSAQEKDSTKHPAPVTKKGTTGEQTRHAADSSRHQTDSLKEKERHGEKVERRTDVPKNGRANNQAAGTSTTNNATKTGSQEDDDFMEDNTVDVSIKTYRRHIKVNGYRIQVYAGGNSRSSHLEADRMTRLVKENFPDQPVYTHFYNPRWICRVGNFRSYEEANSILRRMKATHLFREASIIKCKIQIAL